MCIVQAQTFPSETNPLPLGSLVFPYIGLDPLSSRLAGRDQRYLEGTEHLRPTAQRRRQTVLIRVSIRVPLSLASDQSSSCCFTRKRDCDYVAVSCAPG